jgi:tetratricopeptide (TPR) repeat protein
MQAASRLMLATSANAVGMGAEARRLLEDVIADQTASGANLVLGEALTVLATLLMGDDDARVLDLLRAAASVARAAETPAEEARYRGQLAWTMVTQRMRAQDRPFLHDDAVAEFETAERLLAGQRTLSAGGELAKLYQYRGQAAFFDNDWPQAGMWLTKAESVARRLGLLPDLAFILSYQGLALIQAARRSGTVAYDQAARLFTEAQELFQRVSVSAFVWQTGFYRALCDIEAARWPGTDDAERAGRLDRASRLMEEASGLIDQLRESSESGGAARQQQVWMAFSVDKQTFYSQGSGSRGTPARKRPRHGGGWNG